jgi:hypothetical protein
MSRNTIIVLIYHCYKLLGLIYKACSLPVMIILALHGLKQSQVRGRTGCGRKLHMEEFHVTK